MKRLIQTILVIGAVMVIAGASSAYAQVTEAIKFSTTFPFTVGNKTFQPGNYTVRPLEGQMDVMEISDGNSAMYFAVNPANPPAVKAKDQVVFTRRGDGYQLKTIWDSADLSGVTVMSPKPESHHHHAH
jgi:hypothetical protein